MPTRAIVPQNALPPQPIVADVSYNVSASDTSVDVVNPGLTMTLPQNPTVALTVIRFMASSAFELSGGAFSPLTPSDPVAVPVNTIVTASYTATGWELDGLGGGGVVGTSYALFFALMPGDNAATVAVGAAVQFPEIGPTSGGPNAATALTASTFQLPTPGDYEVAWQVSVTEAGQLALAIGGAILPDTVVGRATGTSQLSGSTIITTVVADSVLSLINPPGNAAALTITPIAGGTHSVSATLSIKRLS